MLSWAHIPNISVVREARARSVFGVHMRTDRVLRRTFVGMVALAASFSRLEAQGTDQLRASQLERARRATQGYRDLDSAKRAGYVRAGIGGMDAPLMGEHWVNRALLNQPFNLERPAVLQYINVGDRRVLVGVAYGAWQRPGEPLPEGFAGDSDQWHSHDMPDLARGLSSHMGPVMRWLVERRTTSGKGMGADGRTQLVMLHVWLYSENPDGIFANYNPALPYLRAGLPAAWAEPGNFAAARGMTLLADDACATVTRRLGRVAGTDGAQGREIETACTDARSLILNARRDGLGGSRLNQVAGEAWQGFQKRAGGALSPEQRQALADLAGGMGEQMGEGHAEHMH